MESKAISSTSISHGQTTEACREEYYTLGTNQISAWSASCGPKD